MPIRLSKTTPDDLPCLYQIQLDQDANQMAAFTSESGTDFRLYFEKYANHLADPTISMWTIRIEQQIVGSVAKFVMAGDAGITYWIDKEFWGQGIATKALTQLLQHETTRPVYAYVAFDNSGSQRVLEKCGFRKVGTDRGFAKARQAEIEEFIYQLD
ncbi:GNAT family N-acetyltransferase [Rheinheimera sp.]|uniref:GNAT family N-acetyltransferase n=1 Tax=Rheinheimera sp. TaxID=1869214 RepID=UPI0026192D9C|nr:GNAT family N-acetyltransferase [Rheinheimera sp.]MCA1931794.1 GNAT family N-acetyltransferase [Rheinheimera sp.]